MKHILISKVMENPRRRKYSTAKQNYINILWSGVDQTGIKLLAALKTWCISVFILLYCFGAVANEKRKFDESQTRYIDNGIIKLGVNLGLGGAICYLSKSDSSDNIINNFDWGRQVQMSFYSGPRPYEPGGKKSSSSWPNWCWNPIQTGDFYGHGSKVVKFSSDNKKNIHLTSIPMQWALDNVPGDCTFEVEIKLDDNKAHITSTLHNARSDKKQYRAQSQELPAIYTNATYYRLMSYIDDAPFTGGKLTHIIKDPTSKSSFPWIRFLATENWCALVNDKDFGVGVYKADNLQFLGGFVGQPNQGGTFDPSTGYMSPVRVDFLDYNLKYVYKYTLIVDSLKGIREYAEQRRSKLPKLPIWKFTDNRQGWISANYRQHEKFPHYTPLNGKYMQLDNTLKGSCMISPPTLWEAAQANYAVVEAAFNGKASKAAVGWQKFDSKETTIQRGISKKQMVEFDIIPDGKFRKYVVNLGQHPGYKGKMVWLKLVSALQDNPAGSWVKIKYIALQENK
jgi:hypothetical protein